MNVVVHALVTFQKLTLQTNDKYLIPKELISLGCDLNTEPVNYCVPKLIHHAKTWTDGRQSLRA